MISSRTHRALLSGASACAVILCHSMPSIGQEILVEIAGQTPGVGFGVGLDAADLNGDGVYDFVVGLSNDGTTFAGAGAVQVFDGATQVLLYQAFGIKKNEKLGSAVAVLGDVDLDGFPDVAVAAPYYLPAGSGGLQQGRIVVASPNAGITIGEILGTGGGSFGVGLAPAGDNDGDGRADLAATAPFEAGVGALYVYSAFSGNRLAAAFGDGSYTPFGQINGPVALFDDLDHDGVRDIAATGDGPLGYRIYSGSNGAALSEAKPTQAYHPRGIEIQPDIDGDGVSEVVVGDPLDSTNGVETGALHFYSGASGAYLFSGYNDEPMTGFGYTIDRIADSDGDGVDDLVVGAIGSPAGGQPAAPPGAVFLVSGATGAFLKRFPGPDGTCTGRVVVDAGDINGDGYPDFAASTACLAAGKILVYSGKCGDQEPHGSGCPGTLAFTPQLSIAPLCVNVGQPVELRLDQALGGAAGLLLFGGGTGSAPVPPGCDLLVHPLYPFALPLALGGSGGGNGSISLFANVPAQAAASVFALQAFVADPKGTGGIAASGALVLGPK